ERLPPIRRKLRAGRRMNIDHTVSSPAASAQGADSATDIREHSWDDARQRFAADWQRLLDAGRFNISLAPDFLQAAALRHGRADSLRVLVDRVGGEIVGLLPFYSSPSRAFSIPVSMLSLGGNLVSYHHEIVSLGRQRQLLRALLCEPRQR